MTTSVQRVLGSAQQLSPVEQLELIQALSQMLQRHYEPVSAVPKHGDDLLAGLSRTPPVMDVAELAADFWPEDESADDINTFVAQQRAADRDSDK